MIWFIADTHFGHDHGFVYEPRGFKSEREMTEQIIENWNNSIQPDDTVYMVGDFCLGKDMEFIKNTVLRLNGQIHLIRGNHDTDMKAEFYKQFSNIVEITYSTKIKYKKRTLYISHYPTLTASLEQNPNGAVFNIHGHIHTKNKFYEDMPFLYNVSCDSQNCKPVNIDDVLDQIYAKIAECYTYI